MSNTKRKIKAIDIAMIGMMIAVLEVLKIALMHIPNVEVVTFLIIIFTIYFGRKMFYVIPAFVLIEGIIFGFGIWWVMYIYIWPLIAITAWIFRKNESPFFWAIVSGLYGLLYGFFCSIPYFVIGAVDGGMAGGISSAITWWIAGIPYDLIHGVSNFIIMIIFFRPMKMVMNKICRMI